MPKAKTKPKVVKLASLSGLETLNLNYHDFCDAEGDMEDWRATAIYLKAHVQQLEYKISTIRPSISALVGSDRIAMFALRELAVWLDKQGPHDA